MSNHWLTSCVALVIAATASRPGWGADLDLSDKVDRLVAPYIEHQVVMGVSVGVLADGQQRVAGYGRLSADRDQQPDGDTVYEIGSMTKVFTGLLLAMAVSRGEVSLETTVQELMPDAFSQTPGAQQPIQLWHLATHTSGLPRLPGNLRPAMASNPYADYTADHLDTFMQSATLTEAPGKQAEYSNLGMGLLGELLTRRADLSYEQLVLQRIAQPLAMNSTGITLRDSMAPRLAPPHSADAAPEHGWDFQALAGAGAVRSTANDLLLFLAAHLDPSQSELSEAIDLAWQVHWQPPGDGNFAMGLGWHVRDGHTRWHNGQTGGYRAMALVSRQLRLAVVVLANTASPELDRLAEDLFRMAAGGSVQPREFPPAVVVAPEVMQRYVGRYSLVPGFDLVVTREADRLMVQATGQAAARVYPKSDTQWFYKVVAGIKSSKIRPAPSWNTRPINRSVKLPRCSGCWRRKCPRLNSSV
jgi:serine-type D-Ala-D-Ala carboxypeptidase/endopeptidase